MGSENRHDFDILTLLKMNNLDIRKIAAENPTLPAVEYFDLLIMFLKEGNYVQDILKKINGLQADEDDLKKLSLAKKPLKKIGNESFIPLIDDVIYFARNMQGKVAADRAEDLLQEFIKLSDKITAARRKESGTRKFLSTIIDELDKENESRKMRVLTVDDSDSLITTVCDILKDIYQVYGLNNPTKLEKFLQQITPELFLLDYKMPELSGFELIPIIRSFEEHKDTPIIFLTSMGTSDHVTEADKLGACDFIVKPFKDTLLREKVAKHIVRKKNNV